MRAAIQGLTEDIKRYEGSIRTLRIRSFLTLALVVASASLPIFAFLGCTAILIYGMQHQINAFNALDKLSANTKLGYEEKKQIVTFWGLISFSRYTLELEENANSRVDGSI